MKNQKSLKQAIREVVTSETSCRLRLSNIATLVKVKNNNFCGEKIDALYIYFDYVTSQPSQCEEIYIYNDERFNIDEDIDAIIQEIIIHNSFYLNECAENFKNNILNGYTGISLDIQYRESEV